MANRPGGEAEARLTVKVQPGASRSQVVGFQGDALRVRVAAPPERGKANDALLELLAQALGVPKWRIEILRGHASRDKVVLVQGLTLEEVRRRLTPA